MKKKDALSSPTFILFNNFDEVNINNSNRIRRKIQPAAATTATSNHLQ
jgi:hypothetical protein